MADKSTRYDEEFKKSVVSLFNNGKTQTSLCKEYGISQSALPNGLNSIPRLRLKMAKFSPPDRLKTCRNATPSLKKKISY